MSVTNRWTATLCCVLICFVAFATFYPWPVVVLTAELDAALDPLDLSFPIKSLIASGFLGLLVLVLYSVPTTRTKSRLVRYSVYCFWWLLVISALFAYPRVRAWPEMRAIEECQEAPVFIYLRRHADLDPRFLSLLVTSETATIPHAATWPFSLMSQGETISLIAPPETRWELLDDLYGQGILQFPEQFDSDPNLDHATRYFAIACDEYLFRTYGKVSHESGERLWELEDTLLETLRYLGIQGVPDDL